MKKIPITSYIVRKILILGFFYLTFGLQSVLAQQILRCERYLIGGCEREHTTGVRLMPKNTENIRETRIFVTFHEGKLYMQSNFLREGNEFPIKILDDYNIKLNFKS